MLFHLIRLIVIVCTFIIKICNPINEFPVGLKGTSSNPEWLYRWAKPAVVVVSQKPPAPGSRDPLELIAQGHFPLLRTWEAGAIRLRWSPSGLVATGFLDPKPPTLPRRLVIRTK